MGRLELLLLATVFAFAAGVLLLVFGLSPERAATDGLRSEGPVEAHDLAGAGRRTAPTAPATIPLEPEPGDGEPAGAERSDAADRDPPARPPRPGASEPDATRLADAPDDAATGRATLVLAFQTVAGEGVPGIRARLRSDEHSRRRTSDGDGVARFERMPAGAYAWEAEAPGREPLGSSRQVMLRDGETRRITVVWGEDDLSISGRVLDPQGRPVPGVGVVANLSLASRTPTEGFALARPLDRRAVSDAEGQYRVGGLVPGEYSVHSVETPSQPRSTIHVRAGVDSADLVVDLRRMLRVTGVVRDERGVPLDAVTVRPFAASVQPVTTDREGRYAFDLDVSKTDRVFAVHFGKAGYKEERVELPREQVRSQTTVRADAVLEPEGDTLRVAGVVTAVDGGPVGRERVELHSQVAGARYRAETDDQGRFELPHVRSGVRYRVRIWPKGPYRDFTKDLGVLERDEPSLEIALESAGHATVSGRIVDVEGTPVPGFDLWLRNRAATSRSMRVRSDGAGRFRVESVPAGELFFETRSAPFLRSEGYRVDERDDVTLPPVVVDWGDRELRGRVLGSGGDPLAGAVVRLAWSHVGEGKSHSANRATRTAEDGTFRFSRLGPGEHRLIVGSDGYQTRDERVDVERVPRELELRLQREPGS